MGIWRWACATLLSIAASAQTPFDWPQFRGPEALGLAVGEGPLFWNVDAKWGRVNGVRFKVPLPGDGASSPIVWGEHVYVTSATAGAWQIYCLDRRTGQILWQRPAATAAGSSSTTLAADARRIVGLFGSTLYAWDWKGKFLWQKDVGRTEPAPMPGDAVPAFSSSPVIHNETVIVQADSNSSAFLAAFSAKDGHELWRIQRTGVSQRSWATPTVIENGKKAQIVCNGWPYIAAYDFKSGAELWRLRNEGDVPISTPVYSSGAIFITAARGNDAPLYAVRPDARGDITPKRPSRSGPGLAWAEPRSGAYMQTPLVAGGIVYSCSDHGILSAFDANTGERYYRERMGIGTSAFTASPVAAAGRIYFTSEIGNVYIVKAGASFQMAGSVNRLGEETIATPAISRGIMYFRTRRHLIAIDEGH